MMLLTEKGSHTIISIFFTSRFTWYYLYYYCSSTRYGLGPQSRFGDKLLGI